MTGSTRAGILRILIPLLSAVLGHGFPSTVHGDAYADKPAWLAEEYATPDLFSIHYVDNQYHRRGFENDVDSDNDGMPDSWEQVRLGTLSLAGPDDPDLDGRVNLAEWNGGAGRKRTPSSLWTPSARPGTRRGTTGLRGTCTRRWRMP